MFCSQCGKEMSVVDNFCSGCGKKSNDDNQENDPKQKILEEITQGKRVACRDGNCVGIIHADGVCGTCGKKTLDWDEEYIFEMEEKTPYSSAGITAQKKSFSPVTVKVILGVFIFMVFIVMTSLFNEPSSNRQSQPTSTPTTTKKTYSTAEIAADAKKLSTMVNQDCNIYEEDSHLVVKMKFEIRDPNKRLQYIKDIVVTADMILHGERRDIYFYGPSNKQIARAYRSGGISLIENPSPATTSTPAQIPKTQKEMGGVEQAVISGEIIKVGQGADNVQSRIIADRFDVSGYNYGDTSKGYYINGNITYSITYGPPKSGSGGYVVQQIWYSKEKKLTD